MELSREKVKNRIASMGFTKKHVAKEIGVHPVMLSYWFSGDREFSDDKILLLKKLLHI